MSLISAAVFFGWFGFAYSTAVVEQNVSGFAWSENIGWISFNDISGGGIIDYGVEVDITTGNLSGYAWSENVGWISFNRGETGPPPSADPCPNGACTARVSNPADIGIANVAVLGWARVLESGNGWSGWIRFDHAQPGDVYIDTVGNFHGWAWSDTVLGWLSFNAANHGGASPYGVRLAIPSFLVGVGCSIPNGASACDGLFSWMASEASNPILRNETSGTTYSTAQSGSNQPFPLQHGNNLVRLLDGATELRSLTINVGCVADHIWNPHSVPPQCVPIPPPPAIFTITANPSLIRSGSTSTVSIEIQADHNLNCTLHGAQSTAINFTHVADPATQTYTYTTRPLTAAQLVRVTCETLGYTGSRTTRIEVVPTIREI
jgi:hypothetical protein